MDLADGNLEDKYVVREGIYVSLNNSEFLQSQTTISIKTCRSLNKMWSLGCLSSTGLI